MARDYHSASSIELGRRCDAAWARQYIDGVKDPDRAWDDMTADARQRAAGLGKAAHAVTEDYYRGLDVGPRWDDKPGQLALALLTHAPERGPGLVAEGEVFFEYAGIKWRGLIDLVDERGTGPIVYDWKTTSSIASWAKDAATLAVDVAASLYAMRTAERLGLLGPVPCRWVYAQTKGPMTTRPVDFEIVPDVARRTLDAAAAEARRLDAITSFETAKKNPLACRAFGAICLHHVSRGGPCSPGQAERISLGARLVQIRKGRTMTTETSKVQDAARSRFARNVAANAESADGSPVVEAAGEAAPAETTARQPREPRTPRAAAPKATLTTRGETVRKLADEFAIADAACEKAHAEVDALDAAMAKAGAAFDDARDARNKAQAALSAALAGGS